MACPPGRAQLGRGLSPNDRPQKGVNNSLRMQNCAAEIMRAERHTLTSPAALAYRAGHARRTSFHLKNQVRRWHSKRTQNSAGMPASLKIGT